MSVYDTPPGLLPEEDKGVFGDPDTFLARARAGIAAFHRGPDVSGSRITRLYSAAVDNTLRALHHRAANDGTVDPSWATEDFCVVATGGYARRALCPWSDVDLLLVTSKESPDAAAALSNKLLYPLWNDQLRVGRREGTVEQLITASATDATLRMCLLDLRFIAGSRPLFLRFQAAAREALARFRDAMLKDAHAINHARFAKYGESVFLLEPQVKEGKGGLRDFHWLGWIMRLRYGLRGDYDLLLSSMVEPDHYREMVEAYEFLLRVRIQLHTLSGRARDQLRFEVQEPVARALGFHKRGGLRAVERFMGAYYRHAYSMAHWCGLYVTRTLGLYWDESPGGDSRPGTLFLGPSAPLPGTTRGAVESEDGLFVDLAGTIEARGGELPERSDALPAVFAFMQETGGRLHHELMEQIRGLAARKVNGRYRKSVSVGRAFRQMLEEPDVFRVLAAMHRTGYLGRLIPEFGATFCQAQHNRAHLYTVDVHCLYVVRELERLGRSNMEHTPAGRAWTAAETRGPLLLAGLLHDIAKSHGAAHSRVGAEMVPRILGRLGYGEEEIERTQWLVRFHLVLSETAYHRDLRDPATHATLRRVIGTRARLDDLMALTWADSTATNPAGFTSWRRALLDEAYGCAERVIDPNVSTDIPTEETVLARVEAMLVSEVGRRRAPDLLARLVRGSVEDRIRTSPVAVLTAQAILLERLFNGEEYATHARLTQARGTSEWTVAAMDRPGLLAELSGAITAAGLSIIGAEVDTRSDGTALDTFGVVDSRGRGVDPGRLRRIDTILARVRRGTNIDELVERVLASAAPTVRAGARDQQRVVVDDTVSDVATVVEVVVEDRPGLVWLITRELTRLELDVRVAKIATRMDLASDTFYVVDSAGKKLGPDRGEALRCSLSERFLGSIRP